MNLFRNIVRSVLVMTGLVAIFLLLSQMITSSQKVAQFTRDNEASSSIMSYHVSAEPFGDPIFTVRPGVQYFWDMKVRRTEGEPCYVTSSWRWVLHLKEGNSVMWNSTDGEFYAGDKTEYLSQAIVVPQKLLPGKYTLSRLSKYKCGDVTGFARTVRSIELEVVVDADKN
jgi:hypothetical protein